MTTAVQRGGLKPSSEPDLAAGSVVGEYVVECKLGEGGFGTVFRASHPLIGKLAAIKVLSRKFSADPEMVSRFIDEARAVNQIRHLSIIDIFSFGQLPDGRSYYVMELLDGRPLSKLIEDDGALPLERALPILRAIARALDAAHAAGIAHRDLKPDNIFLATQTDGTVFPKLLDFGIAKLMGERDADPKHHTATGMPIGTPSYMSPEQCRGIAVDHRTDIYAFGCVAYELLTGKVAFDADDHLSVMFKQISTEPVPVSQLVTLPDGVDDVIAWLMHKEPAERPPDLITAIHGLEQAARAAGLAIGDEAPRSDRHTPIPRRTPVAMAATVLGEAPPKKTSRAWLALVGVAVVAAAIVIVVAVTRSSGSPSAATDPAPAAPSVAAKPAFVTIDIVGTPAGTEVFGPAGPLGTAPGKIQVPRGDSEIQLSLRADGYQMAVAHVVPSDDRALEIALDKKQPEPVVAAPVPVVPAPAPATKPKPVTKPVPPKPQPPSDPYGRK